MSKKTISVTIDDKTAELIERIGSEVLYDDNVSRVVRYSIRYTSNKLLDLEHEERMARIEEKERHADYSDQRDGE